MTYTTSSDETHGLWNNFCTERGYMSAPVPQENSQFTIMQAAHSDLLTEQRGMVEVRHTTLCSCVASWRFVLRRLGERRPPACCSSRGTLMLCLWSLGFYSCMAKGLYLARLLSLFYLEHLAVLCHRLVTLVFDKTASACAQSAVECSAY